MIISHILIILYPRLDLNPKPWLTGQKDHHAILSCYKPMLKNVMDTVLLVTHLLSWTQSGYHIDLCLHLVSMTSYMYICTMPT